jgi:hypothetical protein
MATASLNYAGAAGVEITFTLTSITDTSWRQSILVDNTANLYLDSLVGGNVQVGTTPTVDTTLDFYTYGQYNTSADFTGGASGTDSAYTPDGEETLFRLLTSIVVDVTSDQEYEWGPVAVAPLYGGWLPQRYGLLMQNNTVATTNATGTNNGTFYTGIKLDSA